jgi:hypothetical protein
VLIEAQAAGLPVFASDSTTTETQFSPYMKFLSLQQSATLWADEILKVGCVERKDMTESLEKAGFDIRSMVHNLYKLYTEKNK